MAIGIILGIVIAIIAIGAIVWWSNNDEGSLIAAIVAVIAIIAFLIVPFSFHTIQTGQVAVVKHLGEITDVKTAGTHYDFWMTLTLNY